MDTPVERAEPVLHVAEPPDTTSPKALLLRGRRTAAERLTRDLVIPAPRWDGQLVARYRLLDALVEGKLIGERVMRQFTDEADRNMNGAIDTLIASCVGFYFRDAAGKLTLLDDGEGAMGYEQRLADYLELDTHSARECVLAVFEHMTTPLLGHARELNEWMEHPTSTSALGEA